MSQSTKSVQFPKQLKHDLMKFCAENNYTHSEAGKHLGYGSSTISRWLAPGDNVLISKVNLTRLTERLDVLKKDPSVEFPRVRASKNVQTKENKTSNCILGEAQEVSIQDAVEFLTTLIKIAPHAMIKLSINA